MAKVESNIESMIDGFSEFEKKLIPDISVSMANNLAFDSMDMARKVVRTKFKGKDLSKAIRVKKATKSKPYAEVYVTDYIRWKENALATLERGGDRSRKSMELAMKKAGLIRGTEILIVDGKVQPWVYVQLMSVLQLNWKAGHTANQTKGSKKRKDAALKRAEKAESKFFVVTTKKMAVSRHLGKVVAKRTGLAPGIYARMSDNADSQQVFRLFKIARKPNYMKRWDLEDVVRKVYEKKSKKLFDLAYQHAVKKAFSKSVLKAMR